MEGLIERVGSGRMGGGRNREKKNKLRGWWRLGRMESREDYLLALLVLYMGKEIFILRVFAELNKQGEML